MLSEIYIEALLVDEELADQVWDKGEISDFSLLWAGQAASLGREIGTGDLTRQLAADAEQRLIALASTG